MPHFIQSNCNVKLFRRPQEQPPVTDGVSVIYLRGYAPKRVWDEETRTV